MNIFRAIFGKPQSVDSSSALAPVSNRPPVNRHVERTVKMAETSESVSELVVLARDYSGYVRQAAVNRCAILAWPELLPAVVERLNDWVPEVRHAARSALMTVIPFVASSQLLDILPAIHHLQHAGRADHTQWIAVFEKNLIRLIDVQAILAAAQGPNVKVARACFRLLTKYRLLEPTVLLPMIFEAGNDIVLAVEGTQLIAELSSEQRRAHYLSAVHSHFGAVRTIALRAMLANQDHANTELAMAALLDLQSSVRDVAAAFLLSVDFDLRRFYRDVLQRQAPQRVKTVQVALMSLAARGSTEDIVLVKTFVSHPRLSVRKAALTAWLKLAADDKDEIAATALNDVAAEVRKFSLHVVRKHGAYIPFASVRSRLEDIGDLVLLLLFVQHRVWDGLECIVQAAMHDISDANRRQQLAAALCDWIRRAGHRYEIPSAPQRAFLTSAASMQVCRELLGGDENCMRRLNMELSH